LIGGWDVEVGDEFEPEFKEMPQDVQTEILAHARLLQQFGPQLGRPRVDTLNDSRHANMKELRFSAADGNGASLSPSTRSARPSSWLQATNPAAATSGFYKQLRRQV